MMFKSRLLLALLLFSGCQTLSPSQTHITTTSSITPLSVEQVQDFVLQKLKQKGQAPKAPKWFPDWHNRPPLAGFSKTPDLTIQDVWLNGQSIQGPQAPSSLRQDWEGAPHELLIKGQFENKQDKDLTLNAFRFTLEPSVLLRAMAPNENKPASRVLLDDAILLTPLAVSGTEIRVQLPQAGLGELLLKGLHKITVIHKNYYSDTLIQVGEPLTPPPQAVLTPQFNSIEVVRNDKGKPRFLRCTGSGLNMTQGKFAYSLIDSEFAFVYQSQIVSTEAGREYETLIHIPDPDSFDLNAKHSLVYATPFGTTFKQF